MACYCAAASATTTSHLGAAGSPVKLESVSGGTAPTPPLVDTDGVGDDTGSGTDTESPEALLMIDPRVQQTASRRPRQRAAMPTTVVPVATPSVDPRVQRAVAPTTTAAGCTKPRAARAGGSPRAARAGGPCRQSTKDCVRNRSSFVAAPSFPVSPPQPRAK
jgi:hypothetical protein